METIRVQGDPILELRCAPVRPDDPDLPAQIETCHRALARFRAEHGYGRGIAAPQLGFARRFVCLHLGATPFALLNPEITWRSEETFEVWDDCLSVPDVIVRVRRHRSITVEYLDERGRPRVWERLPEEMSELLQHEIDHLHGVLMTARAVGQDAIRPIAEHAARVAASRRTHRLSLDAIAEASRVVDPVFLHTPQYECEPLSKALGCRLTLKVETANPIRSFKGRGADFFLSRLVLDEHRPIVCASAGNFGQAMAYVCRKHGRSLTVFAATTANPLKIERMRHLGADVRLAGDDFDDAKDASRAFEEKHGALRVEDGREPAISEGAGSLAVELLARGDHVFDDLVVPLGNGALLAGVARWFKAASPATKIYGVCSTGADAMERALRTGRVIEGDQVRTIADGIGVRVPVPEAVADLDGLVDEVLLVDDDTILQAMRLLFDHAGLVTEPAGAVGVAALLADDRFAGRSVGTVLCGSNMTAGETRDRLLAAGRAGGGKKDRA